MLGGIFFIDVGDFTCLSGEREKLCPGGRLPLNAGELEALLSWHLIIVYQSHNDKNDHLTRPREGLGLNA